MNVHHTVSKIIKTILFSMLIIHNITLSNAVICNLPRTMWSNMMQLGDGIAHYSLAKILSLKYDIPFYYNDFHHHDLFVFSDNEKSALTYAIGQSNRKIIKIRNETDIEQNLHKNVILIPALTAIITYIDSEWVTELKKGIKLKNTPVVFDLPKNVITVGVPIRKGNGGGQYYDGEQSSLQEFDFDRQQVIYRTDYENYPFEWPLYQRENGYFTKEECDTTIRNIDTVQWWQKRFPPNQYYIDQILKLSTALQDRPLFVQICTDDKNPELLVERIKKMINKPNITFHYDDNRHLPYHDRIHHDLYMLSRTDVLIRSESGFARTAELLGNHKMIMYPLKYRWEGNKLLMTEIVIKGSIEKLLTQ